MQAQGNLNYISVNLTNNEVISEESSTDTNDTTFVEESEETSETTYMNVLKTRSELTKMGFSDEQIDQYFYTNTSPESVEQYYDLKLFLVAETLEGEKIDIRTPEALLEALNNGYEVSVGLEGMDEIDDTKESTRSELIEMGFSDEQIDEYFYHSTPPNECYWLKVLAAETPEGKRIAVRTRERLLEALNNGYEVSFPVELTVKTDSTEESSTDAYDVTMVSYDTTFVEESEETRETTYMNGLKTRSELTKMGFSDEQIDQYFTSSSLPDQMHTVTYTIKPLLAAETPEGEKIAVETPEELLEALNNGYEVSIDYNYLNDLVNADVDFWSESDK